MLCGSHSLFPECTHAPILLGEHFILGPPASNTVSPVSLGADDLAFSFMNNESQTEENLQDSTSPYLLPMCSASPPVTMNEPNVPFLKAGSFLEPILPSLTSSRILHQQYPAIPIIFISCITIIFF